jgi:ABC-type Fe3+/spermidine/putrescine transport system ATPase subunit
MASKSAVAVQSLHKSFASETVLRDVDVTVEPGEFCVVIGPSGCGKSTLLECIAGLLEYESGTVRLRGDTVDGVPVQKRNLALVFQEFEETLFPHKTVFENVAFGLEQGPNDSEASVETRIEEMLDLLAISETSSNRPDELSGGQQQRVELARQLVRECDITLLDDPLADLDYKLQKRMEIEMRRLHEELDSTFVYVTHNQDQALKLADRVVVLNDGMVEQVGTPADVYHSPENAFVGRFVGDSNPLVADPVEVDDGGLRVDTDVGPLSVTPASGEAPTASEGLVLIRPEDVHLGDEAVACSNTVAGRLEDRTYTGELTEYSVSLPDLDRELQVVEPGSPNEVPLGTDTPVGFDAADALFFEEMSVTDDVLVSDLLEV